MYKQIGNAVSLQHGRALGKELFNALYAQWESEKAANGEEMFPTVDPVDSDEFEGFDDDVEMKDTKPDDGWASKEPIVISDSE